MKIMINGMEIFADAQPHGPQRFAKELVFSLDKISNKNEIQLLLPSYLSDTLEVKNLKNIKVIGIKQNPNGFKARYLFSKVIFPKYVDYKKGFGVDLSLSFPFWRSDAVCIFDCIAKEHPEECVDLRDKILRFRFLNLERHCIKRSKIIFTISEYSKNKINQLYSPNKKIEVLGCGWQHIEKIEEDKRILYKNNLKQNEYLFTAGVGMKRKNFKWIIEAAKQNPENKFVIAGSNAEWLLSLYKVKCENIILTGYVSDSEYKALLSNAKAYIQPSLEEGFGIPPLEALGVGTGIIISDIPIFREIYEDCGYYINPLKYDGIDIDKILDQKVNPPKKVLAKYSWYKSAMKLYEVLKIYL